MLGELVLIADHVLDRHRSRDRPEVAHEDVLDLRLELRRRPIQEASCCVGDRLAVVADLVHDDAAQVDLDLLLAHAGDGDLTLVRLERQSADLRQSRQDQRAASCHDVEAHALAGANWPAAGTKPRDNQRLVGLSHAPARPEQEGQCEQRNNDGDENDAGRDTGVQGHLGSLIASVGETSTVRPPRLPTTSTWVYLGIVASLSAPRARNLSVPCRTSIITSPRCPGVISAVTRASLPTTSRLMPPSRAVQCQIPVPDRWLRPS